VASSTISSPRDCFVVLLGRTPRNDNTVGSLRGRPGDRGNLGGRGVSRLPRRPSVSFYGRTRNDEKRGRSEGNQELTD
jgi:hypothetical protein